LITLTQSHYATLNPFKYVIAKLGIYI